MKTIGKLLRLKKALKKEDIAIIKAMPIEILPVADASYVEVPKEKAIDVQVTMVKDPKIAKKELHASMGNTGKMSAAHLGVSAELNAAKENYKNDITSETREQLMQALTNQALPIMEEIISLKKGLEASNQVCPNLDKYMNVVKAQLCYSAAGNNTLLLGSAMFKLNEIEKSAKANIQTPSISKHELDSRITNLLSPAGLIKEEIQIFDKAKYHALKSIPKTLTAVELDSSSGNPLIEIRRSKSFNAKKDNSPKKQAR